MPSGNSDYIVSTFKDGDTLIEYESEQLVTPSNSMVFVEITCPVLRVIEKVVEIHITNNTSPPVTAHGVTAVRVTQPGEPGTGVVGFTISVVAASTTIAINLAVVGF